MTEATPSHEPTDVELTIVMPCLNEAETIGSCVSAAMETLRKHGVAGEVVVGDNGSTDGSREIAERLGARVVPIPVRGYGAALAGAIAAARGRYVLMGDSDDSYDFRDAPKFLAELRKGYDLALGNRFAGGIMPGAMPPLHRYFGNPGLTFLVRLFYGSPVGDLCCGLRAFTKDAFHRMDLRTTGMEYATEMVMKATLLRLTMIEVPTVLRPDGRGRPPHLKSWRDGWRIFRFMLLYSPRWLFLYPGFALMAAAAALFLYGFLGPETGRVQATCLLLAATAGLLGFQSIVFAVFSKTFSLTTGLILPSPRMEKLFKLVTLETGIAVAAVLSVLGLGGVAYAFLSGAGVPGGGPSLRLLIPSLFSLILGFQVLTSSFFMSVLGLARK